MRKALKHFFRKWYVIMAIIIVVIFGGYLLMHRPKAPVYETATAAVANVVEKVSVTGAVVPVQKADLAFEKGGVIAAIGVKVGDTVKKGGLIAKLDDAGDVAALDSAQAKLDDISRGLRPEELASEQVKVDSATIALSNAKEDALNAARMAYIQAQASVVNYADSLFTNPQSPNPVITVRTDSQTAQNSIDSERVLVGDTLARWKTDVDSMSQPSQASDLFVRTQGYADSVKNFLNDLSGIVNALNPGNSGLSQSAIDAALSAMNSALSGINQSVSSLTSASSGLSSASAAYDQANNDFKVAVAGSSAQAIRAQSATVDGFKAELAKDSIDSPIDGVVTRVDPSVGEFVAGGTSAFSVESVGQYKIEAYVPEADIAKVAIGNSADVTLDAYGSDTHFPATVTAIDPAETVLEGVPTYKVTLHFDLPDARIRSGMTANTDILTHEHDDVISVPSRAVINDPTPNAPAGSKAVRLLSADGKLFTTIPVSVGLKGSDGTIEIVSGLAAGQKVVTYVK